jgi:hypothetical protein
MKTHLSTKASTQGTSLLVALFLTTILAVTIGGYLKHAYQQHYIGMRSQVWNSSIAISESGIEEALQQLNTNPTNLTANGWAKSGTTYSITRPLTSKASYSVVIDAASMSKPTITSIANLTPPTWASASSGSLLAAIGLDLNADSKESFVSRAIQVKCGKDSLFLMAMVAKSNIVMNGNGVLTDSFDSSSPDYSTDGKYPENEPWKLRSHGDVASNLSVDSAISSGNANIYGKASVGPGGSVYVGPNGGIGEISWVASNPGKIQDGYFSDDMNFTFWSYPWPGSSGATPQPGTITTTTYEVVGTATTITTNAYPAVVPASGVTTNATYTTVNVANKLPSPIPYGTTTNYTTVSQSHKNYPKTGDYIGTPYYVASEDLYYYEKITGTTFTYPTYSYSYAVGAITNMTTTSATYDLVLYGTPTGMDPAVYYLNEVPSGKIYVSGNAVLKVGGDVKLSGADDGIYLSTDAKLKMIVNGSSVTMGGNGVINPTGYAQNFALYATDNVTSLTYSGNAEFIGVIYAPMANVSLNGGGNSNFDFIGAVVANFIKLNGHFKFHYDEALRGWQDEGRYKVTEWDEIPLTKLSTQTSTTTVTY